MRARAKTGGTIDVSIVSANPETLDGLQTYLRGVGIPSRSARAIEKLETTARPRATVAIVFPDDFDELHMRALMHQLRHPRPRLLHVIITREPHRFREAGPADGRSLPPIILPKPSFGWEIVDAIRAHTTAAEV